MKIKHFFFFLSKKIDSHGLAQLNRGKWAVCFLKKFDSHGLAQLSQGKLAICCWAAFQASAQKRLLLPLPPDGEEENWTQQIWTTGKLNDRLLDLLAVFEVMLWVCIQVGSSGRYWFLLPPCKVTAGMHYRWPADGFCMCLIRLMMDLNRPCNKLLCDAL